MPLPFRGLVCSCDAEGRILGISLLSIGFLIPYLHFLYHIPVFQIIGFFTGIVLFLYLPGLCVLDLLKWKDNSVSLSVLSILVGIAASPILYYLAYVSGQQWLFLSFIACSCVWALYRGSRAFSLKDGLKMPSGWWKAFLMLFIVLAVLHLSHFTDLVILQDGGYRMRTSNFTETVFHLGIVNAIEHSIPPDFPYASGYTLSEYHIDMHILTLIFTKYLGIDTSVMTFFFIPFLLMGMIIAVPAVLFYALRKDVDLGLFFGLLMLGSDFSFIPGLLRSLPDPGPWTLTFCTTIWSFFTLNGIMVAVPLFFGAALAYQRFFASRDIKPLLLFSLFAVSAFRMKSSMGFHIVCAAFAAIAFMEWRYKSGLWRKAVPVLFVTLSIILIDSFIKMHSGNSGMIIKWEVLSGLIQTADCLGIDQWRNAVMEPLKYPFALTFGFMIYLLGFLGVRVVFFKYCHDTVMNVGHQAEVIPFFLIFIISGLVLSEVIYLGGKHDAINNAVWFRVQSIIAATYFVADIIFTLRAKNFKIAAAVVVIFLSFPTTLNFLMLRCDAGYFNITRNNLLAVEYIKGKTPVDSVVLEYPHMNGPSLSSNFAGRNTVLSLFRSFLMAKVESNVLVDRIRNLRSFFTVDDEENRLMIVKKYGVNYLVVPSRMQVQFTHYSWATRVYDNPEVTIYKISIPAEGAGLIMRRPSDSPS